MWALDHRGTAETYEETIIVQARSAVGSGDGKNCTIQDTF